MTAAELIAAGDVHVYHHSEGTEVAALVDDGRNVWRHHVLFVIWDPEDGDMVESFVADVLARGWTFAD